MYQRCPKCGAVAYARSLYDDGYYCFPRQGGCGEKFPPPLEWYMGLLCCKIGANRFLRNTIECFSHGPYYAVRHGKGDRLSKLILEIKNSFLESTEQQVRRVCDEISSIVSADLDKLVQRDDRFKKDRPVVMAVPRSKPDGCWHASQLQFRVALSLAIKKSRLVVKGGSEKWIIDAVDWIQRVAETKTTHKRRIADGKNNGPDPYPGITRDTCQIRKSVRGRPIVLVDDIYTADVGIDEDCAQFLLDNGASSVLLYTLGKTTMPEN